MSLSDLLELGLDLANGLVLELLDLFERGADHAEGLWVDARRRQDLIRLRILGLEALLDGL